MHQKIFHLSYLQSINITLYVPICWLCNDSKKKSLSITQENMKIYCLCQIGASVMLTYLFFQLPCFSIQHKINQRAIMLAAISSRKKLVKLYIPKNDTLRTVQQKDIMISLVILQQSQEYLIFVCCVFQRRLSITLICMIFGCILFWFSIMTFGQCRIKYYNGCLFHMVQKDFTAQTGDPTATGTGGDSIYK